MIDDKLLSLVYRIPELIDSINTENRLKMLELKLQLKMISSEDAKAELQEINRSIQKNSKRGRYELYPV